MNNFFGKIVVAAGGTGGHVFPAYSLAKHFAENKINVEIISDKRGIKYLKDCQDLKITLIPSSTIFNKNIFKSFFSIIIVLYSILKSFLFLLKNRPNLVFGMGGYSSFPTCIASKILGIPFIIYENNLHIGRANKYLLPFAKKIFVSHKELKGISAKYEKKVFEIGNIIRKEILNLDLNSKALNQIDNKLRILVLGGSQAAKIFGEKITEIFKECSEARINLKIYQQCLPEQNKFLISFYKKLNIDFEIFNFSNNIQDYFSKVNLAITRSGSSMLAELINVNIPFICIPLPSSADNHQLKNAIYYEKNGFGYLIEERDISKKLFQLIKQISENNNLLDQIKAKQRQHSDKTVYENIDKQLYELINEKH